MVLPRLKPVYGYDEHYVVSDTGTVYGRDRLVELPGGGVRVVKGLELAQKKNKEGYRTVVLCLNGENRTCYVHRLVAQSYIDNPDNLPYVNHKDGNPANNRVDNLEWVTHSQNVRHGYNSHLNSNQGGTHSFAVGVFDSQLGRKFDTVKQWAEARGLNYHTARNILNGFSKSRQVLPGSVVKLK